MYHKSYKSRLAALAAACAVMLTVTGCGEDTMYSASFDGTDIPAGIYIYHLFNSYYDAQSHMGENDTDVFAITIDEKNAADWMIDSAKDEVREYAAVEKKFDEYGLSLDEGELANAKSTAEALWGYYGEYYKKYGIAESSFTKIYQNNLKSDKLFDAVYGEGGEAYLSDDDIKSYLKENYALINYIDMHLVDSDENLLKSDGKAERMAMAREYVERIKNGEDFDDIALEYHDFFYGVSSDASGESADGTETIVPYTETVTPDDIVEEDSDTAANEDPADVTEEENPGSENTENTDENSPEDEGVSEENSEETFQAEVESSDANAEGDEEDGGVWADDTDTAEEENAGVDSLDFGDYDVSGTEEEEEDTSFHSNEQVIKKGDAVPDETVSSKIFDEMSNGDVIIVEEDEHYYIVMKYDILEDETYFISAKDSLIHEMKDEDFESLEKTWADGMSIRFNDKAIKRYAPKKFAEEE